MKNIEMAKPDIDRTDIKGVIDVLKSGRLALGPKNRLFEKMMCEYIGVKHAITVNSGTSALHLLVKSIGIKPGDEVIVPSFTFSASVNAILYEGGIPVFADIIESTMNLDPESVEKAITPRTKGIMAVDVFGHPADWDSLKKIAENHGLWVIDDSCEALGAMYKGKKIGTFGTAATFAFYPNKQMTTGEGGIIVTNDDEIARLCISYRNQGRDEMGAWLEHARLGYNYRLDELSASLGCTQLARLEKFVALRSNVANYYNELLAGSKLLRIPTIEKDCRHSWFVYVVRTLGKKDRNAVIAELEKRGIPARGYFSPIHQQKYISRYIDHIPSLPVTEKISTQTVALPFYNNLPKNQMQYISKSLIEIVEEDK